GYDVIACPGPSAPSYACVGSHHGRCALMDGADVVVLDLHLASDTVGEGAPAWALMLMYARSGKPIVVTTDERDPVVPTADATTAVIHRYPTREALLAAVGPSLSTRREDR